MNGRYALAQTPEERMAIAMVAAINAYFLQNPQGVMPGQGFIADFLKPFLDRELMEARLDEVHRRQRTVAPREREILELLKAIRSECERRIHPH